VCVRINPPSILRSYIHAYNSHSFKDVFDVYALDLQYIYIYIYICVCSD